MKKEALFAALDTAGHLDDLLANLPAVLNGNGTSNDAGVQLAYAMTLLPTSAGALYVKNRYYASDPAGWATLLSSAGTGNTQPSTVAVAAVVASAGARGGAVMDQATVTAMLATKAAITDLAGAAGAAGIGTANGALQSVLNTLKPAQPSSRFGTVLAGLETAFGKAFYQFYDPQNKHIRPTNKGSPASKNGPADYTSDTPFLSDWEMDSLAKPIFNKCLIDGSPSAQQMIKDQ